MIYRGALFGLSKNQIVKFTLFFLKNRLSSSLLSAAIKLSQINSVDAGYFEY